MPKLKEIANINMNSLLMAYNKKPWMISQEVHDLIGLALVKSDINMIAGFKRDNSSYETRQLVSRRGSVAMIEISGIMTEKSDWFSIGMETIAEEYNKLIDDDTVSSVVVRVTSPGGTAAGAMPLHRAIKEGAKKKPVVGYISSLAASAGYLAVCACPYIVIEDTARAGSIGVIIQHYDVSESIKNEGVKVTNIVAGEDKALGNPYEPLSEKAKAYYQGMVDDQYSHFTGAVKSTRDGVNIEEVANGRVFTAKEALKLKLVDKIGTLEDAILTTKWRSKKMTSEELKIDSPEAYAKIVKEAEEKALATLQPKIDEAVNAEKANSQIAVEKALSDEKARCTGIKEKAASHQGALAEKLIADGKTVMEAMETLFEDMKANPVTKEMLTAVEEAKKLILAEQALAAPDAIPSGEGEEGGDISEKYQAMPNSPEKTEFYGKNKVAILEALSKRKQ